MIDRVWQNLLMLAQEPVHLEAVKHLSRPAYKRIKRPYKRKIDRQHISYGNILVMARTRVRSTGNVLVMATY